MRKNRDIFIKSLTFYNLHRISLLLQYQGRTEAYGCLGYQITQKDLLCPTLKHYNQFDTNHHLPAPLLGPVQALAIIFLLLPKMVVVIIRVLASTIESECGAERPCNLALPASGRKRRGADSSTAGTGPTTSHANQHPMPRSPRHHDYMQ